MAQGLVKPNNSQLSALSRLFSSTVFREMGQHGCSAKFSRLFEQTGLATMCHPLATVGEGFDVGFSVLRQAGLRDEYVYRAAVTQKVLMGKHSLNTASMLTEFRTGNCKADLVILNGTATVYEIKSERDSLSRITNQVANYRKVFAAVNVITSSNHIDAVLETVPQDVGVLCLSNRYRIQTEREALVKPERICPITALDSLRSNEAQIVLRKLGIPVPNVPNTRLRSELRAIFAIQNPVSVHEAMVTTLKQTRNISSLSDLIKRLPQSLQAAALVVQPKKCAHDRLIEAVSTPLAEAKSWE